MNTITTNWIDKYRPQKSENIIGDKYYANQIKKFLDQFTTNKNIVSPNFLIVGKNGIGKTLIVDLILHEYSFEKITINLSNVITAKKNKKKSQSEMTNVTKNISKTPTGSHRTVGIVYSSITDNNKPIIENANNGLEESIKYVKCKSVLVFDDISTISNPKEKEAIKTLIKMNNKNKKFPIIIISNMKHNKLVNEIRKMVTYNINERTKKIQKIINEIKMKAPNYCEIEKFIKNICIKEQLNIISSKNDDDDIYSEIVTYSQYDMRRLINCLEELKLIHGNSNVTLDDFIQYQKSSKMKDIDPNIYEATELLLNKYTDINDSIMLYSEERATIPLMIHENYPLNIRLNYPTLSALEQINIICDISKNISESDKIDGLIYSNQCWNLQSIHGFYGCVMPSYHINRIPNKLSIKEIDRYIYTQDYTKTSTRKINNKVIRKSRENIYLKRMMTNDFLHITNIIKKLLMNNEYDSIIEIMNSHELSCKDIESIINIDRISRPKFVLGNKTKNIIKEKLKN